MNHINACCAECGKEGGGAVSLKTCRSCMSVSYCNADCQRSHWPKHKKICKQRAAELHDEALFKDPPPKKDCPICFLPMPTNLITCISLPPATIESVPVKDFAIANEEVADKTTEQYYTCCGKYICGGCAYSSSNSGNSGKCPFCNSDRASKTDEERVEEMTKRVEANDPASIFILGDRYYNGGAGLQQDYAKAIELYARAAELGYSKAHNDLAVHYAEGGNWKKAKFHFEAAAMAGHDEARNTLGYMEGNSGNIERAIKHLKIAASAGHCDAMHQLRILFEHGHVSRESIETTLTDYNNSCAEMRSEERDAYIRWLGANG